MMEEQPEQVVLPWLWRLKMANVLLLCQSR